MLVARWLKSFDLAQKQRLLCFGAKSKKNIENLIKGPSALSSLEVIYFDDSLSDIYKAPLRKKAVWKVLSENYKKFKGNAGA